MANLFWQWDRVRQAIDWLMSSEGDLHYRLGRAWQAMGEPFQVHELPTELQPIYRQLEVNMRNIVLKNRSELTPDDIAIEETLPKYILNLYRYLTEHRAFNCSGAKILAVDILK